MGLFDTRIAYKPFEYPVYYTEGWLKQAQAFWLHTEISMQGDIKDWHEKLTPAEKNLVGNILSGFAPTECAVSDYWTQKVTKWFTKHEIQQMALMFGSQETVHAVAYSYLNETLGLEDYEAFLHEPATASRFETLVAYDGNDPVGIAKSLAVFSAFAEGVSLYSAFAVLYSFQLRNSLKGIGQQMKWSVRDESLHSKMGCQLFRHMCDELAGLPIGVYLKLNEKSSSISIKNCEFSVSNLPLLTIPTDPLEKLKSLFNSESKFMYFDPPVPIFK